MSIHENSAESYKELDRHSRRAAILSVYDSSPFPLTDREVAQALNLPERNGTAPEITGLIKAGVLVEVGKRYDRETKRNVRITRQTVQGEIVETTVRGSLRVCLKNGTWVKWSAVVTINGIAKDSNVLNALVDLHHAKGEHAGVDCYYLDEWFPSDLPITERPTLPPVKPKNPLTIKDIK